jgi:hypothetical protein
MDAATTTAIWILREIPSGADDNHDILDVFASEEAAQKHCDALVKDTYDRCDLEISGPWEPKSA